MTGGPPTGIAVVGFAQSPCLRHGEGTTSGVEMLVPIFGEVLAATGLAKDDIGFWCSGSSDYLAGRAFSFVLAVAHAGGLGEADDGNLGHGAVTAAPPATRAAAQRWWA